MNTLAKIFMLSFISQDYVILLSQEAKGFRKTVIGNWSLYSFLAGYW